MTRKRRVVLIVVLTLVLAVAAFCLWYTHPRSFSQLVPGAPPCQEIQISAHYRPEGARQEEAYHFSITPDNPIFDQLLSLFEHQTYRRSLRSLLPDNHVQTHAVQPGDFRWIVSLDGYEEVTLADGSRVSGTLFQCNNYYGTLYVGSMITDQNWQATVPSQGQWVQTVMDLIHLAAAVESQ